MANRIQITLQQVKKFENKLERDLGELEEMLASGKDVTDDTLERMSQKHSSLLEAYAATGDAKVKGICAFLETLIESGIKFIVFAHHYTVLDRIEFLVAKLKANYIRIDGRIDIKKRYDAVRKFQTDPKCKVAILSLTASGQGITLTTASCVVFAEMNWTPGMMIQAEDRAHRIGQASSVTVYYLHGEGTLDDLIYPRLRLKSEVFATVVDGTQDKTFKIAESAGISQQLVERVNQPYAPDAKEELPVDYVELGREQVPLSNSSSQSDNTELQP